MQSLSTLSHNRSEIASVEEMLFDPDYPELGEHFEVDSLDKATWAANRFLSAENRIKERRELGSIYKKRIDTWVENANKTDKDTQMFMKTLLNPFVKKYLSEQKRGKSLKVLGARIGFRKNPGHLEIIDEEKALEYCQVHLPDILMQKTEISKAIAKSYITDGFQIPGIEIADSDEELVIKELVDDLE